MLDERKSDAEALQMCLSYLSRDAEAMQLPFVQLLIGLAIEEIDRVLGAERRKH